MTLFYSIEMINKVIGLFITGILARFLSQEEYGTYLSGIILFGYLLEFSFFGSQNRHNASYSLDRNYLASLEYPARRMLTGVTALIGCLAMFLFSRNIQTTYAIWPLAAILIFSAFTFDYIAYGEKQSWIIVIARFVSQLTALFWILSLQLGYFSKHLLYVGNFLQSTLMMLVITFLLLYLKLLPSSALLTGIFNRRPTWRASVKAFYAQSKALSLRMLALALVSGELIVLSMMHSKLKDEFVISIRLIQVAYPFVIFYVDSKISSIDLKEFEGRYLNSIFWVALAIVFLSPWIAITLFGTGYANIGFTIALFAPSFMLQASAQYLLLASQKSGRENRLITSFVITNVIGVILCSLIIYFNGTIRDVALLVTFKSAVLFALLPELRARRKIHGIVFVSTLSLTAYILEYFGYFQIAADFADHIHSIILRVTG